jgi:flagellar assembly factor FliW
MSPVEEHMSTATIDAPHTATLPVIEFVAPLPGFPDTRSFVLVRLDDDGLVFSLTSVDTPDLRFLVMPPQPFFPDYAPEIDDESLAALGAGPDDAHELLVLLVITTGEQPSDATANLMAPIVLHLSTRRAVQLVLATSGLAVRAPLLSV